MKMNNEERLPFYFKLMTKTEILDVVEDDTLGKSTKLMTDAYYIHDSYKPVADPQLLINRFYVRPLNNVVASLCSSSMRIF